MDTLYYASEDLHDIPGTPVDVSELETPKAAEFASLVKTERLPHLRFVECRTADEGEIIVLDVMPEVPQQPAYDIRPVERVAVRFDQADQRQPAPFMLRRDFPLVPHVNLGPEKQPRSLCMYETRYDDQKASWTAARFARQLHTRLSKTAQGNVHEADQPLEQIFLGTLDRIVIPSSFYAVGADDLPEKLNITGRGQAIGQCVFVATGAHDAQADEAGSFFGVSFTAPPTTHGALRAQPRTLQEIATALEGSNPSDKSLLLTLRERLRGWFLEETLNFNRHPIFLIRIPKRRRNDGPIEEVEVCAFLTSVTLGELGAAVGVWDLHDATQPGLLMAPDEARRGEDVPLTLLNPTPALTRKLAAQYNGLASTIDTEIVAIGAGTLGSQVVMNLGRVGFGRWTVVDEDILLPHNVARHYLTGDAVGYPKAEILKHFLNNLHEKPIASAVVADVLAPHTEELTTAFDDANVIFDLSASVTVARHVALDVQADARRVSLFLSPSGSDLVLLAEPSDRTLRLDVLEMEYYRAVVRDERLGGHLEYPERPIRYAHACRDVSVRLSQEAVALHAAIGARAVRTLSDEAAAVVWRAEDDLTTTPIALDVARYLHIEVNGWRVAVSQRVLETMSAARTAALPNETGGVLIGAFDNERCQLYIADHLPAPSDSVSWPTAYIRGIEGLQERIERIGETTAHQLEYVGEWHSHPDRASVTPSDDDDVLFDWLAELRALDGIPAVMAIAGDAERVAWHVGSLEESFVTHYTRSNGIP